MDALDEDSRAVGDLQDLGPVLRVGGDAEPPPLAVAVENARPARCERQVLCVIQLEAVHDLAVGLFRPGRAIIREEERAVKSQRDVAQPGGHNAALQVEGGVREQQLVARVQAGLQRGRQKRCIGTARSHVVGEGAQRLEVVHNAVRGEEEAGPRARERHVLVRL